MKYAKTVAIHPGAHRRLLALVESITPRPTVSSMVEALVDLAIIDEHGRLALSKKLLENHLTKAGPVV